MTALLLCSAAGSAAVVGSGPADAPSETAETLRVGGAVDRAAFSMADTTAPSISNFQLTNPSGSTLKVEFESDEELKEITVGIDLEDSFDRVLDETDFTNTSDAGTYTYTATFTASEDGNYTAQLADAKDAAGNDGGDSSAYNDGVTVDTTAPTISSTSLSDATNADGTVTDGETIRVTATVSDDTSNVSSVTVDASNFGGGSDVTLTDGNGDGTYDTTVTVDGASSSDGDYSVTVTAKDDASPQNSDSTTTSTLEIDTTPPSLSNFVLENDNSPGDPVGDGDTVRVAVDVSETANNVANVEVDLSAFGAPSDVTLDDNNMDGTYDATVTVDEASANEDGSYSVTITTSDDIGNQNTGTTPSLELNTKPDISNVALTNVSGQSLQISFDSTEQLSQITVSITGATTMTIDGDQFTNTTSGSTHTSTATFDPGTDGDFTATLDTAVDSSTEKKDGASGQSDSARVDTTAPTVGTITITDADDTDGVVTDGDSVTVSVSPSDATSDIDTVTADLSAFGGGSNVPLTEGDTDGTYDATITVDEASANADGTQSVDVTVTDTASQSSTKTGGSLDLDTTAPSITIDSVTDGDADGTVVAGEDVTVTVTVTDAHSISDVTADLSAFDAGSSVTLTNTGGNTYEATVQAGNSGTDGASGVSVTASDAPGNQDTQAGSSPSYDAQAPTVDSFSLTDVTDGNGTVGDGDQIRVAVSFSDVSGVDTVTGDFSQFGGGSDVTLTDGDADGTYDATITVDKSTAAGDGDYAVSVEVTDEESQSRTVSSPTLELDTTPPSVSSVTLTDATNDDGVVTDGDQVRVNATVSDATAGVKNVTADLSVIGGGSKVTLTDGNGDDTYEATVTVDETTATGSDGSVSGTVTSYDLETNQQTASSSSVTLDTTPPTVGTITITDADDTDGVVTDGDSITVSVSPSDATSGVDTVTADLSAFGGGSDVPLTDGDTDGTYDATITVDEASANADGTQSVDVTVTDTATQSSTKTGGSLDLDTTAPSITIDSVTDGDADGTVVAGEDVTVTVTVTDAHSISDVTADLSAFDAGSSVDLTNTGGNTYEATVQAGSSGTDGASGVSVTASDAPGNQDTQAGSSPSYDGQAPTVDSFSLTDVTDGNGTVGDGDQIRVAVSFSDVSGVDTVTGDFSQFGGSADVTLTDGDADGTYDATITVDKSAAAGDGDYAVAVDVTDEESQSRTVDSPTLELDTSPPILSSVTLADATNADSVVTDGDQVRVTATVTDATAGVKNVTADLSVIGGGSKVTLTDGNGDDTYEATVTVDTATATGSDGSVSATVRSYDLEENEQTGTTSSITYDTTPPTVGAITITDADDSDGVVGDGDSVTVSVSPSDATSAISGVSANLSKFGGPEDVTLMDGNTDGTYDATITVDESTAVSDGTLDANVTTTDDAGLTSSSVGGSLDLDTTAPTLSGLSVSDADADGSVVAGEELTVTATVSDAHSVDSVTVDLSAFGLGSAVTLTDGNADGTYETTVTAGTGGTQGSSTADVTATDAPGNSRTAAAGSLIYDTQPPTVGTVTLTDETDSNGVVGDSDTVEVSVSLSDTTGVRSVTANLSKFGGSEALTLTDGDGDDTYNATATVDRASAKGDGEYVVTVNATDEESQSREVDSPTLRLDSTPPQITTVSLSDATNGDGIVRDGETIRVTATVTDAVSGVDSVEADLSAFGGPADATLTDGNADDTYDATITVDAASASSDGSYGTVITASDAETNQETDTTGTVTLDTTAPTITDVTVTDGDDDGRVTDGEQIEVNVTTSDATAGIDTVTVNLSAFGGSDAVTLTDGDADDTYDATATVDESAADADGSAAIEVNVTDNAGISATDSSESLTLDTTPPTISAVTISDATDDDGVVIDGDQIQVTATVSDASGVATVQADLSAFGGGSDVTLTDGDADGTYDATVTVDAGSANSDGSYTGSISVTDGEGLTNSSSPSSGVALDTSAPAGSAVELRDVTDQDGIVSDGDRIEVNVTLVDDTAVANVTANLTHFGGAENATLSAGAGNTYSTTISVDEANASRQGTYAVNVSADDGLGHEWNGTTGTATIDKVPIVSNFTTRNPDGKQIWVRVNVSEPLATLRVALNGPNTTTLTLADFSRSGSTPYTYTATWTPERRGDYAATLRAAADANDKDGADGQVDAISVGDQNTGGGGGGGGGGGFTPVSGSGENDDTNETDETVVEESEPEETGPNVTVTRENESAANVSVSEATPGDSVDVTVNTTTRDRTIVVDRIGLTVNDSEYDIQTSVSTDPPAGLFAGSGNGTAGSGGGTAGGTNSTAGGTNNTARGTNNTAGGTNSTAGGTNSTAGGTNSTAGGTNSTAGGTNSTAGGTNSTTGGTSGEESGSNSGDGGISQPTDEVVGYVTVNHSVSDDRIDYVTFSFEINKERLDSRGISPQDVALFRLHNGTWMELDAIHTATKAEEYVFRATSPGLSVFAVGTKRSGRPQVLATSVNRSQVTPGSEVTVSVTLRNERPYTTTRTVRLALDGNLVATRTVSVPGDTTQTLVFTRQLERTGTHRFSVNGTTAGVVSVEPEETATPTPTATATATATPTVTPTDTPTATATATATTTPSPTASAVPTAIPNDTNEEDDSRTQMLELAVAFLTTALVGVGWLYYRER